MQRGSRKNRYLDFVAGIPLLNLFATLRSKQKIPQKISRVGVMCSPALGDTLLFSAVLLDLRRHFSLLGEPVEIIHFCMRPNLAAAELLTGADRCELIEVTQPLKTMRTFRSQKLDLLLDFSSWQRLTAFYSMVSGARFSAGFRTPGMYRSRGYDLTVEHRNDRHEVDNFRSLLEALAIPTGMAPAVCIPKATGREPLDDANDLVVFHLWPSGQRSWLREWPQDRWLELAGRLKQRGTIFVVTGSPTDLPRTEEFIALMKARGLEAVPFTGSDGFKSLARLLKRARVVVSVNTGVMHLAAIVGAPTVSINGPNRNGRWGPIGPRAFGVESPGEGCGYLHLGFNFDGQATDCMERITVDHVEAAVELVSLVPASMVPVEAH